VLKSYEDAYRSRDTQQVALLWPALSKRDLDRVDGFFRIAREIDLRLEASNAAEIKEGSAVVRCRRVLKFFDDRGQQRPVEDSVSVALRKRGERWVIESIQ
jgi:hypothetical protein